MPHRGDRAGRAPGTVCTLDPMGVGVSTDYRYSIDASHPAWRATFQFSPGRARRYSGPPLAFWTGGRILPLLPHVEAQLMERSSPIIDLYLEIGKQPTFAGVIDMFAAEMSARIGAGSRPASRRSL